MKFLKPITLKPKYYDHVEKLINRLFYKLCYEPIIIAMAENKQLYNETDPLADAIRSGRLFFDGVKFSGEYSSNITKHFRKLGGKYDKSERTWTLPVIPSNLKTAISDAQLRVEALKKQMLLNLEGALNNINQDLLSDHIIPSYTKTVYEINQDFLKSVQSVSVPPELTAQMTHNIAKAWGQNLDLYIKKWTEKNILKLREEIATNVYQGKRAESLEKTIQKNYGVSRRKAKFLARQETSLLMSQVRQERFKDAGITKYMWIGVMDERERHDHKLLEDKIFTWDNPPITNLATGARNHPGEDYNCRCIARPIYE